METIQSYEESELLIQQDFVMLVAKTKQCSACAMIVPHLKQKIHNLDTFENYQIYVDEMDAFRGKHVIFSVPTVLIFSKGKEILRESRFINIDKINRLIDAYFSDAV